MEITKTAGAAGGGWGRGRPAEQGFALIYLSMLCHSLEIGSSKLVKVSQMKYDEKLSVVKRH